MFFGIDHLVFCGTRADHSRFTTRLEAAGFVPVPGRLRFDDSGVHSESIAYKGGGFIETVYQVAEGAPEPWFGGAVPRLMGIGISSDSFDSDTSGWLWTMDEEQVLDDGSTLRIHAAGPHEHLSELYLFAMDRPERLLDHPQLGGQAELVELTFAGAEHELWRRRITEWLGKASAVGDVEFRFVDGAAPTVSVTPTFRVFTAAGSLELAAGAIELISD